MALSSRCCGLNSRCLPSVGTNLVLFDVLYMYIHIYVYTYICTYIYTCQHLEPIHPEFSYLAMLCSMLMNARRAHIVDLVFLFLRVYSEERHQAHPRPSPTRDSTYRGTNEMHTSRMLMLTMLAPYSMLGCTSRASSKSAFGLNNSREETISLLREMNIVGFFFHLSRKITHVISGAQDIFRKNLFSLHILLADSAH